MRLRLVSEWVGSPWFGMGGSEWQLKGQPDDLARFLVQGEPSEPAIHRRDREIRDGECRSCHTRIRNLCGTYRGRARPIRRASELRPPVRGSKRWSVVEHAARGSVQASFAWRSLKPGPRALYIELRRCYNGINNGAIILSHRDAAKALNAQPSRCATSAWPYQGR